MQLSTIKQGKSLELAILEQIVFLDLFDYPLTAYEVFSKMGKGVSLEVVWICLEKLVEMEIIAEADGFYFLKGRRDIIEVRNRRYNYSCSKLKIARRFSFLFSWFPGVKAVAAVNFIGGHNLRQGSDIDFFIITATRRIWLSRLFCAGAAKLLNRRPTRLRKKDKICLSFYVADSSLDLSNLALAGQADPYFYHWLQGVLPLSGNKTIWKKFQEANRLGNVYEDTSYYADTDYSQTNSAIQPIGRKLVDFLEKAAKMLQLKIMAPDLKAAMNKSDGVVVSDEVLKLYLSDRRLEFADKFNNKLNEVTSPLN